MKNFDTGSVIAVCALISVLFGMIQFSVWPIKKDISQLEVGQAKIEKELKELKIELKEIKNLIRSSKQAGRGFLTFKKS